MERVESKVAFITGGGSGIGRAAAGALARRGYSLAISDVNGAAAKEAADELVSNGAIALAFELDVTVEAQVRDVVDQTVRHFGRLDAAVNSAGIQGDLAPAGECTLANWEQTLAVNLTGTWLCMKEELRAMLNNGGGSIVNLASNFGLVGKERIPAYCASKHGVIGLTKSAALDYARQSIRVNAVCPGPIGTPLLDRVAQEAGERGAAMRREVEDSVPMGRIGTADEVAHAIAWLCSDEASFATGMAMPVDGGFVTG